MNTRVVVTGMGAITPIGNSVEAFWTAVKSNTVGICTDHSILIQLILSANWLQK